MTSYASGGEGYHPLEVRKIIDETSDTRSFVLDIPDHLRETFAYRAGQFVTFRVNIDGEPLVRSYSMASSPDTDADFKVTVKRVPQGRFSNWMNDTVAAGDVLDTREPAGRFCLKTDGKRRGMPVIAFGAGSGITPVISVIKSALATTERPIRLLYANRDRDSIIFYDELESLSRSNPDRLGIVHRLDVEQGFLDGSGVTEFVGGNLGGDFYICGPGPFMDIVEKALRGAGVDRERIFIERFEAPPDAAEATDSSAPAAPKTHVATSSVTVTLRGKEYTFAYHPGDTILETVRRGGQQAPSSCEQGNCATCLARLKVGAVHMKANNVLTAEEVAEGLVLTCQSIPTTETVTVDYED
jgi:3-ketosteroid 9alpha-monooxygenase subunit B